MFFQLDLGSFVDTACCPNKLCTRRRPCPSPTETKPAAGLVGGFRTLVTAMILLLAVLYAPWPAWRCFFGEARGSGGKEL